MKHRITTPMLKNITITDPLFSHYVNMVSEKIIPYQWEVLNDRIDGIEKSYVVKNFKIAAGEDNGKRQGAVFCDTDAYKWIETLAYCLESGKSKDYENRCDELIDLIGRAQEKDGYLNTYFSVVCPEEKWKNLAEGHELYSAGHLFEAAVAYFEATGKRKLLDISIAFADLIYNYFMEINTKGYPGHQEIELALVKLAKTTNDKKYLLLAKHFIDIRGEEPKYLVDEISKRENNRIFPEFIDYDGEYSQSHILPIKQTEAVGHAVRAMYMYSAMADLANVLDDKELENACQTLWSNVTRKRMYITGGIGSSGHLERFTTDYDLPNDRMYCESCASVGLMMFGQRMAALTGEAAYYDTVERALCNTVLGGISAQGDKYFYVNPLEVWPDNCMDKTSMKHVKPVRQPWFVCACCPPNIARTLASLGQYIYSVDTKGIYINQFIGSKFKTNLKESNLEIELENKLYDEQRVITHINKDSSEAILIRIRIPKYFENTAFKIDGKSISPAIENGYAIIAISKAGKQVLEITGNILPVWFSANRMVRANIGKTALTLGPYVYCLEEADNGAMLSEIYVNKKTEISICKSDKNLPGNLPTLSFDGYRINSGVVEDLYGRENMQCEEINVNAIPYGLWCNRTPGEMLVWIKEYYN